MEIIAISDTKTGESFYSDFWIVFLSIIITQTATYPMHIFYPAGAVRNSLQLSADPAYTGMDTVLSNFLPSIPDHLEHLLISEYPVWAGSHQTENIKFKTNKRQLRSTDKDFAIIPVNDYPTPQHHVFRHLLPVLFLLHCNDRSSRQSTDCLYMGYILNMVQKNSNQQILIIFASVSIASGIVDEE
ncbi:MAG: hypothetical protein NC389_11960 [Acetatifactor muris]|nr:hypothetical protein [Acetatifactor muris]